MDFDTQPEIKLLLCCARTSKPDAERAARVRELLRAGIDWDKFLRVALRHGVMPLVYRQLLDSFAGDVPAAQLARLQQHYRSNATRNLFLSGELCRILRLFEEAGVEAVPYKGPALAVYAYGDVALRQFMDLDILVRPRDVRQASALLAGEGYVPHFPLSEEEEAAFLRLSYVQLFTREELRSVVELHWGFAPRFFSFPLRTEELWKRLETVTLAGMEVRAFALEDLLLLLCVHGTKDIWERLEWICCIAELVGGGRRIGWERVVRQAEELGGERMLLLGLSLAHELLGASLPEEILRRIEGEPVLARLCAEIRARLFAEDAGVPNLRTRAALHLRSRERLSDRVRYCARLALTTTPVDWALVRLPRRLAFVYYVLRPFRLLRKYVLSPPRCVL